MDSTTSTVDEYISLYPVRTQTALKKIRKMIKTHMPTATEKISYGIPTYALNGRNVVHFGAYPAHISIYPGPSVINDLNGELGGLKTSKGTIQFPIEEPISYQLIQTILERIIETNQAN